MAYEYNRFELKFHRYRPSLVMMIGPPGAGKSTYAKLTYPWHVRISQDEMGRGGHWQKFIETLKSGTEVLIDRMNFSREQRKRYIFPAMEAGYRINMILFEVDNCECLRRMEKRREHPTLNDPAKYREVLSFYNRSYEEPTVCEFDSMKVIRVDTRP